MSTKSQEKITDALNNMVEAANHMFSASLQLKEARDKSTLVRLEKIRHEFRELRLEVANRLGEALGEH